MTLAEAEALPEWPTALGFREEIHDGKRVQIPVEPLIVAFFIAPDDLFLFEDSQGRFWRTGQFEGVRYKIRSLTL